MTDNSPIARVETIVNEKRGAITWTPQWGADIRVVLELARQAERTPRRVWFYEDDEGACSDFAYANVETAKAAALAEVDPQAVGPDADPELVAHYTWEPVKDMPMYYLLAEDGRSSGYKVYGFDVAYYDVPAGGDPT